MVDFTQLKSEDRFFECCEYHWMARMVFIKLDKEGYVKCKFDTDFGIFKKGEIHRGIGKLQYESCFLTRNEAVTYQNECKLKMKKISKDELLKILYEKCRGNLTDAERNLFKEMIY